MIPESFKQDLLNRVELVDVIEHFLPLKKAGANHVACCPFHSEKTPSFTVSPSKQFYHCFGCGAHGNAIGFLMEYSGLGYVEAVKELADRAGMKMPEYEPPGKRQEPPGPDLYEIMQRAAQYYRESLRSSPRAIGYLKGRGLTGRIAAQFGIGYAPEGWQNLQSVFGGYPDKSLKDCGLVIDGEGGRRYDRFRDRIMFPILNQRGSVIGFGGRVIVVEGYMDVVALAQHGIDYAVATLGTATTSQHVQKLFRQSDDVVFCFDGDAAGVRAAWSALEVALPVLADHKAVRFLLLPQEHDPDSFVREHGTAAFEDLLAGARPLSEFFLNGLQARVDMGTLEGKSRLLHEAKPLLKRIAAPALQVQLVKSLAELSGVAQSDVERILEMGTPAAGGRYRGTLPPRVERTVKRTLEHWVLKLVVDNPELATRVPIEHLNPGSEATHGVESVANYVRSITGPLTTGILFEHFRDTAFERLFTDLQYDQSMPSFTKEEAEAEFPDHLRQLERQYVNRQISGLNSKARDKTISPEEIGEIGRLTKRLHALDQRA